LFLSATNFGFGEHFSGGVPYKYELMPVLYNRYCYNKLYKNMIVSFYILIYGFVCMEGWV